MALSYWDRSYAQWVYQYLKGQLNNNDIGTSSLMGNLYAESAICPYRCQSQNYTQSWNTTQTFRQNNENYFVTYTTGGGGYSLAQWTYPSRKRNYYQFCTQALIGDNTKSAEFLIWELNTSDYIGTYNVLISATDINYATKYVMKNYERPADQSDIAIARRQNYAREVYNDFSGLPPLPPGPDIPIYQLFNFDQRKKHPLPIDPNMLI